MKNLVSKLLPLVEKLKGKKPVVIILSVVAIGAYFFAVSKGYLKEDVINLDTIINYLDSTFTVVPADSVELPVDTVQTFLDSVTVN